MKEWLKLDNAAKIFPSVSNHAATNLFSISFVLKEEINPTILEEAVSVALERFPYFKVKLCNGLFWYYLDENKLEPHIQEENPFLLELINRIDNRGYLFRVGYYRKKISLEVFHSLTDGYGAMQFIKSIVHAYLLMTGKIIKDDHSLVLTDVETVREEYEDAFLKNYDKTKKIPNRSFRALHFKADKYTDDWVSVIIGSLKQDDLKPLLAKYNATVTQFLSAAIMVAASQNRHLFEKKKLPFQIIIPVNLRKYFPSKTLRNFSLIIGTKTDIDKKIPFEEALEIVKGDFARELDKERLHAQITANVKFEKMFIMRIVPLFLKKIALKIGYALVGTKPNSFCISNLGKVEVPEDMVQYVDEVIFSNGVLKNVPMNMGVTGYNGKIFITISSSLIERTIQRDFFRLLTSFGLPVVLETNELEV